MKKFGLILLTFLLVLCNSSNESTDIVDTSTTTINEEISIEESDVTTTTPTENSLHWIKVTIKILSSNFIAFSMESAKSLFLYAL